MHLNNESIMLTLLMQYLSKQDLRLLDKFSFLIGCMLLQHLVYKEKKKLKRYKCLFILFEGVQCHLFQLYRGCQFYWWRKPEDVVKTTTKVYHIMLYTSP